MVHEALRFSSMIQFGVQRGPDKDIQVGGYLIPKVIPSMYLPFTGAYNYLFHVLDILVFKKDRFVEGKRVILADLSDT